MSAPHRRILSLALFALAVSLAPGVPAGAQENVFACEDGFADRYPCENVDLLAHLPNGVTGGGGGNDIWGWTDPETGHEYALVGKTNGTAFVDITVPEDPVYLGLLPTHETSAGVLTSWRDIKVYEDHAYVVAEETLHGMQVFDLTRLRGVTSPQTWTVDTHYPLNMSSHNIAINEESGYAYALGSGAVIGVGGCSGLHMIDIRDPKSPVPAGCFQLDGYTHDAQCVIYRGPDERYRDGEICLNSNEDTLTIVDVTNKLLPEQLSRVTYPGAAYTHQGWLTEDQRYFLLGDEGDEGGGRATRTYIFDVSDLTAPELIGTHHGRTTAIDHNLYVRGQAVYQANYTAGLQVYSLEDVADGVLEEIAYFDLFPANDSAVFNGAWSNYPYFDSGVVVLNGMQQGLFVLRPRIADLSLSVSADPDPVAVGQTLTYSVTVGNEGPAEASDPALTLTLPTGVAFASAAGADCAVSEQIVTCDPGAIAAGGEATISVEVVAEQTGDATLTATVSASEADPFGGDNTATETTTVG